MLLQWAEGEGWNPGLDDATTFHAADPHGFFTVEADGEMVAVISVVKQGASHAFLGLCICKPEYGVKGWMAGLAGRHEKSERHDTIDSDRLFGVASLELG